MQTYKNPSNPATESAEHTPSTDLFSESNRSIGTLLPTLLHSPAGFTIF